MKLPAASYGVCSEEESPQEGRLSLRALMPRIGAISQAIIRERPAHVRGTLELLRHASVHRISSSVSIVLFRAVVRNSLARNRKTRDASA